MTTSKPITFEGGAPGAITLAEIRQQPALWPTTLDRVQSATGSDLSASFAIISGAGTSAYAAAAIAAGWPQSEAVASTDLLLLSRQEMEQRFPRFTQGGVLISVARSGDSPESLAGVKAMQRWFPAVRHLAITCNAAGSLANHKRVEQIVLDPRTNDRSLVMTSSFSNLTLAGCCLRRRAEIEGALPAICRRVEAALPSLEAAAKSIAAEPVSRVAVLASGALRPLASEASLKVLEMTAGRTVTLAETFVGLRHGPMSFLTPDSLVVCFLSSSQARRRYEEDLVRELRQKKLGRLVGIASEDSAKDLFDVVIPAGAAELPDDLRVPFEVPFAQLLAYELSLASGLNPDSPSPDGVITRVVQGFRIHDNAANV